MTKELVRGAVCPRPRTYQRRDDVGSLSASTRFAQTPELHSSIRKMRPSDMLRFRELEGAFPWGFGDDLMEVLVYVDKNDVPIIFCGAWRMAEVHVTFDGKWSTPGMRLSAFRELHRAMEASLKEQGVGRVVTWMDGLKGFCRRMMSLGWVKSDMESWTREVR